MKNFSKHNSTPLLVFFSPSYTNFYHLEEEVERERAREEKGLKEER
jgi:hypothetical protein